MLQTRRMTAMRVATAAFWTKVECPLWAVLIMPSHLETPWGFDLSNV